MARYQLTGPDGKRYEVTTPEDASESDVLSYFRRQFETAGTPGKSSRAAADVDWLEKQGYSSGMGHRVVDTATFGAFNPGAAAIGATLKTAGKAITGQNTDWSGDYAHERDVLDEQLRRAREGQGLTDTATEMALALPFMPIKIAGAGVEAAAPVVKPFLSQLVDASKMGAVYGGLYGLNSARGDLGEHVKQTLAHAAGGAVLGPAIHSSVLAAVNAPSFLANLGRLITGRAPEQVARVKANIADAQEAGVGVFGPAVTDNPVYQWAARGLANRPFIGAPLRQEAKGAIDDVTTQARSAIERTTGAKSPNDVGADVQADLRRAFLEETTPRAKIEGMATEELPTLMGGAPRPKAEPVAPRDVPDQAPKPVDPNALTYQRFEAEGVPPKPVQAPIPKVEDVPIPREAQRAIDAATRDAEIAAIEHQRASDAFHDLAASRGVNAEALWQRMKEQDQWHNAGHWAQKAPPSPERDAYLRVMQAHEANRTAKSAMERARIEAEAARDSVFKAKTLADHEAQAKQADAEYTAAVSAAEKAAQEKTAAARAEAMSKAEREAQEAAAQETARLRAEAAAEAEQKTAARQADLDKRWEGDRGKLVNFEPGRTRESYKTEFGAAYEQLNRETKEKAKFQRHALGERPDIVPGEPPTATAQLLEDFALQARRNYQLPGYEAGKLFGKDGKSPLDPSLEAPLARLLGADIARKLMTISEARAKGRFGPDAEGMREFATEVRRAQQAAERSGTPGTPGMPLPERAAALKRLHGALKEDYHRFLRTTGPEGVALSEAVRNVDAKYGEHLETMRRPLAKVFGEKTAPVDAMDMLAKAAEKGDLSVIRPYMRAMAEKADPTRGAGAIVSHMTQGAADMGAFLQGWRALPKETRAVLFSSEQGRALEAQLNRLATQGAKLEPFARAIQHADTSGGLRPGHVALGIALMSHFWPTVIAYGGSAALAKFMASPSYVNWLTKVPAVKSPQEWTQHVARLAPIAERDSETGTDIRKAVSRMVDALNPGKAEHGPAGR